MPVTSDPRYSQSAIAGPVNSGLFARPTEEIEPSTLEVFSAAARQSNIAGAAYERFSNPDPDLPDAPAGWDPLDHIAGYEEFAHNLSDARTPSQLAGMINRIESYKADKESLRRAGLGGFGAEVTMNILDPTFLASIAVPEAALARSTRLYRAGQAAARGAAEAGAYEIGMHALQENRTAQESIFSVGAGALLGGVLGSILKRAERTEMQPIMDVVDQEMRSMRSTGGAAASMRESTLARESLAAGGKQMSGAMEKIPLLGTDLDKVMASDSVVAKQVLQETADVPAILGKNLEGEATPASVESFASRHDARLADFADDSRRQWVAYKKRVPSGERMSEGDFYTAIASASRRSDSVGIPEVDASAKLLRDRVFDPLKRDAIDLGLLEDPVQAAQRAAEKRAVDKYVAAETRQIYDNYRARVNQAIAETDSVDAVRGTTGLAGDALPAGERSAAIRAELERATDVERAASQRALDDIDERVAQAERKLDETLATLKTQRDSDLAALRAQNEANAAAANTSTKSTRESLADELTRALATERQVRTDSVNIAEEALENAQRDYARERSRISRDVEPKKRRQELLRAKLALQEAKKKRAVAVEQAKTHFSQATSKLRERFGKDSLKAASKAVREEPSLRAAYEHGRDVESARAQLQRQRMIASRDRAAEKTRARDSIGALNKKASTDLERLRPESRKRFVARAKRVARGVADDSPEVNELAKLLREQGSGTLGKRVTVPKVDERYVKRVTGADSYFRRMYDRESIRANLPEWKRVLRNWFMRSGNADASEVDAAIEDVTKKILGADVGQANFATKITVPKAGPLQERTLDIPDQLIEKFLVNDPLKVARAYVRELGPQVEMKRRFGDVDMSQQLQSVSDDYAIMRKRIEDSRMPEKQKTKELNRLIEQEKNMKEALIRIRDRILGRAGRLGPDVSEGGRRAVMAARGWRNWVASARLGATALTGGTMDTARIAAQYGFLPTFRKLAQLVGSKSFRKLSKEHARRAASAVEVALSRRVQAAYDGALTEGWTEKLANGLYKYTGLNHIMDFNRTLAASLFEDAVISSAKAVASGKSVPRGARARLASIGIGTDELQRIAAEIEKHGGELDGIGVSGSADWDDKALADLYDAAVLRESKIVVQQPGAADRVWWMDSETGKLIGQLKSFSLSAPARLLMPPVQALGRGEYATAARFIGYMLIGGYLTHSLRQTLAGKEPTTDPKTAAVEAITESGVMGIFPDLLSPVGRRLGLAESARLSDRNVLSAYGGPALGLAGDVYDFAMNRTEDGISARDLHMLRRMLPFNNAWMLRRQINALEGEAAEALDLRGADSDDFLGRIVRTDAVLPSGQRGGTGTGKQEGQILLSGT
jgi:hypothetical protein